MAEETRKATNSLTNKERRKLLDAALKIIYKGQPYEL